MKLLRLFFALLMLLQLAGAVFLQPQQVQASANTTCSSLYNGDTPASWTLKDKSNRVVKSGTGQMNAGDFVNGQLGSVEFSLDLSQYAFEGRNGKNLEISVRSAIKANWAWTREGEIAYSESFGNGMRTEFFSEPRIFDSGERKNMDEIRFILEVPGSGAGDAGNDLCTLGGFSLLTATPYCSITPQLYVERESKQCTVNKLGGGDTMSCIDARDGGNVKLKVEGLLKGDGTPYTGSVTVSVQGGSEMGTGATATNGAFTAALDKIRGPGRFTINLSSTGSDATEFRNCQIVTEFSEDCGANPTCNESPPPNGRGYETAAFDLCSQMKSGSDAHEQCVSCVAGREGPGSEGVWTAIGCIPAEPSSIIKAVVTIGVGIGGGVALIMTLIGGFLLTTSQGNPKQQETAKEMITSAVIGLLFVLFSVVILQFIGVTILQIPGFGAPATTEVTAE